MPANRGLRAMACGWLLIGALLSVFGALMLVAAGLFVSGSTPTTGVVVDHERRSGGHRRLDGRFDSDNVVLVVEYREGGGALRRIVGNATRDKSGVPAVGARVPVRYQRLADGTVAQRIDTAGEIWGLPAAFTLFGLGFLGAGVLGRRAANRDQRVGRGPAIPRGMHRDPEAAARLMAKLRRPRR